MQIIAWSLLILISTVILCSSRRVALGALILGYLILPMGIKLNILSLNFPAFRFLLLISLIRMIREIRSHECTSIPNRLDYFLVLLGVWTIIASLTHQNGTFGFVYMLGSVFNIVGVYIIVRSGIRGFEDLRWLIRFLAPILAAIALEMVFEQLSGKNLFAILYGGSEEVLVRNGRFRASGAFRHAILAGTVGASCIPLFTGIFAQSPKVAKLGIISCLIMVGASASSGPIMTTIFSFLALTVWRFRFVVRPALILVPLTYFVIEVLSDRPAYYMIDKIDLAGGSTAWHRAKLIDATISHFSEWALFGTDYTRHWIASGVSFSEDHVDFTNYYVVFAVWGGVISLALLVVILTSSFRQVAVSVAYLLTTGQSRDAFLFWCVGSTLFAHVASSFSIAYFDQSYLFFWMPIAAIASLSRVFSANSSTAG